MLRSGAAAEVSAAEISRNFAVWQDRAMTQPVVVTRHGRPRVVLLSADAYSSARSPAPGDSARFERSLHALLNHMTEGFIALDRDLRIVTVNRAFEALTDSCASQLMGKTLEEGFPRTQRVFCEFVQRALKSGEVCEFEVASVLVPGRLYRVRAFPYDGGVAALLKSRLDEHAERERSAMLGARLEGALSLPGVSWATANLRGLLTETSPAFADSPVCRLAISSPCLWSS